MCKRNPEYPVLETDPNPDNVNSFTDPTDNAVNPQPANASALESSA